MLYIANHPALVDSLGLANDHTYTLTCAPAHVPCRCDSSILNMSTHEEQSVLFPPEWRRIVAAAGCELRWRAGREFARRSGAENEIWSCG